MKCLFVNRWKGGFWSFFETQKGWGLRDGSWVAGWLDSGSTSPE
jgi:hypothetical protein